MEYKFCYRCATKLTDIDGHVFTCDSGHTVFLNASPTAGIFVLAPDNKVLLSIRGIHPYKGKLDSFGGFVDGASETVEEAAVREMHEELGLQPGDYEPLTYLTSATGPYPFGGEVHPVLTSFFWTRLVGDAAPTPQDDVADIVELPLHDVSPSDLANDDIRAGFLALQQLFPKE